MSSIRKIEGALRHGRFALSLHFLVIFLSLHVAIAWADEVDGFTEPYRTIDVAAIEVGLIDEFLVREGETVEKNQPLAKLDNEVHEILLLIAKENMKAKGRLTSVLAELKLRRQRLGKLETLEKQGHARKEEVERARADSAIAEAQVLSAREEMLIKELEYKKIQLQLRRRTIRAPIDGVISIIHKDEGELVSSNDPYIIQMVQLNPLLATFAADAQQAKYLRIDQRVPIRLDGHKRPTTGVVEFISPVTDAESGTVRIKVRIDNSDQIYRSGERCFLKIPTSRQRDSN